MEYSHDGIIVGSKDYFYSADANSLAAITNELKYKQSI